MGELKLKLTDLLHNFTKLYASSGNEYKRGNKLRFNENYFINEMANLILALIISNIYLDKFFFVAFLKGNILTASSDLFFYL